MTTVLTNSARRVQEFLAAKGFACAVRELPGSTRTAEEAARSIGCEVAQIAKSLIFKDLATDQPILVIASGKNLVDLDRIEEITNLKLGRADGRYVKERVGFAIGGIPPAGHLVSLNTLLDRDLQRYETLWAAAGTPFAVFSLKPDELAALTAGTWLDLAMRGEEKHTS